jgi:hypothetical protein
MDHVPQADTPTFDERRRDARQSIVARATLFVDQGVGAPQKVELRNISVSGCSFRVRDALVPGNRYRIKIEIGPMSYASPLRIISTTQLGHGQYDVGAEFIRNELAMPNPDERWANAQRVGRNPVGTLRPAI